MALEIGHIDALYRYPVKSMAGTRLAGADLAWHGIAGDRRLALRKMRDRGSFPWLSASTLPELLQFTPLVGDINEAGAPTHVRTPDGQELDTFGDALAADIERRHGAPVQMMALRQGIFDEASVSVISTDTVREIESAAGSAPDMRRFRPNIVVRLLRPDAFQEDQWVGGTLAFGEAGSGPRVSVTMPDERCSMVNLDPDSARSDPRVLRTIVRMNRNNAGIYGVVTRPGRLEVGQIVVLHT